MSNAEFDNLLSYSIVSSLVDVLFSCDSLSCVLLQVCLIIIEILNISTQESVKNIHSLSVYKIHSSSSYIVKLARVVKG